MTLEQYSQEFKTSLENCENVLICIQKINDVDTMASGLALTKLIINNCPNIQSVRLLQVQVEKTIVGKLKEHVYWPLHDPQPSEKTLFITTDVSKPREIDEDILKMAQKCGKVARIDHHEDFEDLTLGEEKIDSMDLNLPSYSSCSEIIWELTKIMDWKVDENITEILFKGLYADSKRFTSIKVNENTFRIASEMFKTNPNCRSSILCLTTHSHKELHVVADVIKEAQFEGKLAILNLNPEIIYQHFPHNFQKQSNGRINQRKILTFPLNVLETMLNVKTIFYIHYCLISPFNNQKKFLLIVLKEPNPKIEKILLDNGFRKQRNRFTKSIYFSEILKLLTEHKKVFKS